MNTSKTFQEFIDNLKIDNREEISNRYKNITKILNKEYYDNSSETLHSLQIGSYGRETAINNVSDLDMLFQLPYETYKKYNSYESNGQSALLQEIKTIISKTYPSTTIKGDGQVVAVSFSKYVVEVLPAFENKDGSFTYPDSSDDGSWKITKPREEISEINDFNKQTNSNLKLLAKMTRAWKNKVGLKIGGLLIDTLCYNFLKANTDHHQTTFSNYDTLVKDFFIYLTKTDKEQSYWLAPGSNQKVNKKNNFIPKAKKALKKVEEAIEKNENKTVYKIWREVFGNSFPYPKTIKEADSNYTSNEEYIEELFPLDITNNLRIECEISQKGFQNKLLRLARIVRKNKKLKFYIVKTDVRKPYEVKWKIKNQGQIAKDRGQLRGQIHDDKGKEVRKENSNFSGAHFVECYIIKNGVCVARDRIDVPISSDVA